MYTTNSSSNPLSEMTFRTVKGGRESHRGGRWLIIQCMDKPFNTTTQTPSYHSSLQKLAWLGKYREDAFALGWVSQRLK